MPVFKNVNKLFFKNWSVEMSYVLGFFAADGSMIKNKRGACFIEFTNTDKMILKKIKLALSSNHCISIRKHINPRHKPLYRLQIGSKSLFADLEKLHFSPNKSKTIALPKVPPVLLGHFVRGYFDGDGNVYFRKHYVKDRKQKRWVFSSRFTSGSRQFLEKLHEELKHYGIQKGFIVSKERGFELILSHKDSLALCNLMYHTMPVKGLYLPRKYKTFQRAIKTLYPNAAVAQLVS